MVNSREFNRRNKGCHGWFSHHFGAKAEQFFCRKLFKQYLATMYQNMILVEKLLPNTCKWWWNGTIPSLLRAIWLNLWTLCQLVSEIEPWIIKPRMQSNSQIRFALYKTLLYIDTGGWETLMLHILFN